MVTGGRFKTFLYSAKWILREVRIPGSVEDDCFGMVNCVAEMQSVCSAFGNKVMQISSTDFCCCCCLLESKQRRSKNTQSLLGRQDRPSQSNCSSNHGKYNYFKGRNFRDFANFWKNRESLIPKPFAN